MCPHSFCSGAGKEHKERHNWGTKRQQTFPHTWLSMGKADGMEYMFTCRCGMVVCLGDLPVFARCKQSSIEKFTQSCADCVIVMEGRGQKPISDGL